MTGNANIFVTLDEPLQSEVKKQVIINTILQIKGRCDLLVKTKKAQNELCGCVLCSRSEA